MYCTCCQKQRDYSSRLRCGCEGADRANDGRGGGKGIVEELRVSRMMKTDESAKWEAVVRTEHIR
jgi:hypothetical protein